MTQKMKSLAVYCGHQFGNDIKYKEDAETLGDLMARNGIKLVFGGGNVGLMGTVATAVIKGGGDGIGITTQDVIDLQEPVHEEVMIKIEKNISDRRQKMFELSDAFCILPGGMGTVDELTDIMVRHQINESKKPIFFLNTRNFWGAFGRLFMHIHAAGFMPDPKVYNMTVLNSPQDVINSYLKYYENDE